MITYIIGTNTGVGKTYYGKKLIKEGNRVIKPIETGKNSFNDINESDCYSYANLQNLNITDINLYFFKKPLSPHLASEEDNIKIDIQDLKNFINKNDNTFVELAGGLMVPLTRNYTQLDLIKDTKNCNVDIVISNELGCINHALMTIEVLASNNIKIRKLFFNNINPTNSTLEEDNIKTINDFYKMKTTI